MPPVIFSSFLILFLLSIDNVPPVLENCTANTTLNTTELSVNLTLPNATDNASPVTYNVTYVEVDVESLCIITFTVCWQNGDVDICIQVFHIGHYKVIITATDLAGNSAPCVFYIWIIGEYLGEDKWNWICCEHAIVHLVVLLIP